MNAQSKLDALVKELATDGKTVIATLSISKGGTESQFISKAEPFSKPVEKPAPVIPQPKS